MKLKEVTSVPKKRGSLCCKDCPKWHPSYCSITCQPKVAGVPACTYGKQLINVEKQKVRNKLKSQRTRIRV